MHNIRQENNIRLGGLFYSADISSATKLDWVASHYDMVGFVPSSGIGSAISYLKGISSDIRTYIILDPSANTCNASYNGKYVGGWATGIDESFILSGDAVSSTATKLCISNGFYMDLASPTYASNWSSRAVNILGSSRADGIVVDNPYWDGTFYLAPTYANATTWSSAYGTYTSKFDGIFNLSSFLTTLKGNISSYSPTGLLGVNSNTLNDPIQANDYAWRWITHLTDDGFSDDFVYNPYGTNNVVDNAKITPLYMNNIYSSYKGNTKQECTNNAAFYLTIADVNTTYQPGYGTSSGYNLNTQINNFPTYTDVYNINIGNSIGRPYYLASSSVMRRSYSNGISVFNTSGTATITAKLDGLYQDFYSATKIATSVLAPFGGAILYGDDSIIIDFSDRNNIENFAALTSESADYQIIHHNHTSNKINLVTNVTGTISSNNIQGIDGLKIDGKFAISQIPALYHNGRIDEACNLLKDPMHSIDETFTAYESVSDFNSNNTFEFRIFVNSEIVEQSAYTKASTNTIIFNTALTAIDSVEVVTGAKNYLADKGSWIGNDITVYKNGTSVTNYTTNNETGLISFSTDNSIFDLITIDIKNSNISGIGTYTHAAIDDKLSEYDGLMDYNLSISHEFNLAQRNMVMNASYGATSIHNAYNYNIILGKDLKFGKKNPGTGTDVPTYTIYVPSYPIIPTTIATGIIEFPIACYSPAQSMVFMGDNVDKVYLPLGRYEENKLAYNFTVGLYNQSASNTPYQLLKGITNDSTYVDKNNTSSPGRYIFDFDNYPINRKEKYYIGLTQTGGNIYNTITWFFAPTDYYWGDAYFKSLSTGEWCYSNVNDFLFETTSYCYNPSTMEDYKIAGLENYGNVSTYIRCSNPGRKWVAEKFRIADNSPTMLNITLWHGLPAGTYSSVNLGLYPDPVGSWTQPIRRNSYPTVSGSVYNYTFPVGTKLNPGYYWIGVGSSSVNIPLGMCATYNNPTYCAYIASSGLASYQSNSLMYEVHGFGNIVTDGIDGGIPGDLATYIPSAIQMQSFTAPANNITSASLYLTEVGNPACNLYLSLEDCDANDTAIGTTSYAIDKYVINSNKISESYIKFDINTNEVVEGSKYIIGLNTKDVYTYDENNYVSWNYRTDEYPLGMSEYKISPTYIKEPELDRCLGMSFNKDADDPDRDGIISKIVSNDLLGITIKDIDLSVIIDNSGSMKVGGFGPGSDPTGLRFKAVKSFIVSMNNTYGTAVNFDLLTFIGSFNYSSYPVERYLGNLNQNILALLGSYDKITSNIGTLEIAVDLAELMSADLNNARTPIYDTLIYAISRLVSFKGTESDRYQAIILFSDGVENGSANTYDEAVALLNSVGINLYVIYLNNTGVPIPPTNETYKLVQDTGNKIYAITDTLALSSVLTEISKNAVWTDHSTEVIQDFGENVAVNYVNISAIVPSTASLYYTVEYKLAEDSEWTSLNSGQRFAPNINISCKISARYLRYVVFLKAGSSPTVGGVTTGITRPNKEYLFTEPFSIKKYLSQILISYADIIETDKYRYNFGVCLGNSETWSDYTPISQFKRCMLNSRIHEKTYTTDNKTFFAENGKWFAGSTVSVYTKEGEVYIPYNYPYVINRSYGTITFSNYRYQYLYITILPPKKFKIGIKVETYGAIVTPLNDFSLLYSTK